MRPLSISISRSLSSPRPAALSSRPHRISHPSHDPSYALRQPSIIPRPDAELLRQKTSPPPRTASRRLQHPFWRKKPITSPSSPMSLSTPSRFISSLSSQAQILPQGSARLQQSSLPLTTRLAQNWKTLSRERFDHVSQPIAHISLSLSRARKILPPHQQLSLSCMILLPPHCSSSSIYLSLSLSRSDSSPSQNLPLGFGTPITAAPTPPQFRPIQLSEQDRKRPCMVVNTGKLFIDAHMHVA